MQATKVMANLRVADIDAAKRFYTLSGHVIPQV